MGCKLFLLLSGLSQTTELQATIKLLRGRVGTWWNYGAKAIGPELLRFQDLAPKLLYCADRQMVGPAFLFHGLEAFCLYLEPTVVMGSGQQAGWGRLGKVRHGSTLQKGPLEVLEQQVG